MPSCRTRIVCKRTMFSSMRLRAYICMFGTFSCLYCTSSLLAERNGPTCHVPQGYAPHDAPGSSSFFQGWYTRVTTTAGSSLAVIMGLHTPGRGQPPTTCPPALCMVLLQPPSSTDPVRPPFVAIPPHLQAHPRYFGSMSMDSAASSSCGGAPSGFEAASVGSGLECGGSGGERGHKSGADSSGAAQGGAGAASGAVCRMRVDGQGMAIEAVVPGVLNLSVSTPPGISPDVTPWSPQRASPEAWVSWLGHAVGLHYATLTLRTPVTYRLTVPPASPAPAVQSSQADHAHIHVNGSLDAAHEVDPYQQQLMQQPRQPAAEERVEEGRGVAHAEAQYGRAFPGRWLWVEGQGWSGNVSSGSRGAAPAGPSFVLAGGDLPHALSPPLPPIHTYLFSYRDEAAGVSVVSDPTDPAAPGLGIREEIDACTGRVHITLTTLTHEIEVAVHAAPGSFAPVACPSEQGFLPLSDESFTATATITIRRRTLAVAAPSNLLRVWSRARAAAGQLLQRVRLLLGWAKQDRQIPASSVHGGSGVEGLSSRNERGVDGGTKREGSSGGSTSAKSGGMGDLVVNITLSGVALEFGGSYRCTQQPAAS